MPRICCLSAAVAACFVIGSAHAAVVPKFAPSTLGPADVQGRRAYYVEYAPGASADVENSVKQQGGQVQHRFANVPIMSVLLPEQALAPFVNDKRVQRLSPVPPREPLEQHVPWNLDAIQARDLWDANRDGAVDAGAADGSGLIVCVIDSGLYAAHDDFAGITLTGTSQVPGQEWFTDGLGHGTHVAGTINAAHNDVGVVGVLPGGAALHMVKVFDNNGSWTPTSDVAAAAEDCVAHGANVINMSLGGPPNAAEERVFQSLWERGVLLVAAAGNSNNGAFFEPAYPASYDSVISVAAVDRTRAAADFTQHPPTRMDPAAQPADGSWDVVELSAGGVNVMSTIPGPPHGPVPLYRVEAGARRFEGQHVDGSGHAAPTAALVDGGLCAEGSATPAWAGNIVLCQRGGDITFATKINTVAGGGGLAAVIYNNVVSEIGPGCSGGCTTDIPGIFLSRDDGLALKADLLGQTVTARADLALCDDCTGSYGLNSGTSMATPGVVGGLALLWETCGGPAAIDNLAVRLLARDSALDLEGVHPGTNIAYGPGYDRVTGWGLLQVADAARLGRERFGATCALGLAATPRSRSICTTTATDTDYALELTTTFAGAGTFSLTGLPAGAAATFDPAVLGAGEHNAVLRLDTLAQAPAGQHTLTLQVQDGADARRVGSTTVRLDLSHAMPAAALAQLPAEGATEVGLLPPLSWSAVANAFEYVVEVDDDADFSSPLATATTTDTTWTPLARLPGNTLIHWRVTARNACGEQVSANASFTTGPEPGQCPLQHEPQVIFEDNAETAVPGWTHSGLRDSWLRYNFLAHSGRFSWYARDIDVVSDQRLVSPKIALPTGRQPLSLAFWEFQGIEASGQDLCYDGALLDISTDDGVTWNPVPANAVLGQAHDGPVADTDDNPAAGAMAWCGDPRDWSRQVIDLQPWAGQQVRFRFRLATDSSTGRSPYGWLLDDLRVQGCKAIDTVQVFGDGFE
jgi:serine protease